MSATSPFATTAFTPAEVAAASRPSGYAIVPPGRHADPLLETVAYTRAGAIRLFEHHMSVFSLCEVAWATWKRRGYRVVPVEVRRLDGECGV